MDLNELKSQVKQIALDAGAKLVGIGSRERLKDTPPSGDMDYLLPGAQSCIIWAFPYSIEALKASWAFCCSNLLANSSLPIALNS